MGAIDFFNVAGFAFYFAVRAVSRTFVFPLPQLVLTAGACVGSVYFATITLRLKAICPMCIGIHLINLALLYYSWQLQKARFQSFKRTEKKVKAKKKAKKND